MEIYGVLTKRENGWNGHAIPLCSTEKNDPTNFTLLSSLKVLKLCSIRADKELTETRRQAGAVIESGVMTPISDNFFTNYPDAFMQH